MEITEFTKPARTFLKAQDVINNPGVHFVITQEGQIVESEFKGQKSQRLHVEGQFNGESKIFDMSKTNARFVKESLGPETKTWIGHQLVLEVYKTKTSDGMMVDALNVKSTIPTI